MSKPIRVAGAALNQVPLDWNNNLTNIREAIQMARENEVDILCLPELSITGYGCEDIFLSDWIYAEAANRLIELIPLCDNITVAIGLPVSYEGRKYNCSCLIHDKKVLGIYAKQNLANDGVHYETRWFSPWPVDKIVEYQLGDQQVQLGDLMINHLDLNIGFEICEDAWREDRPGCRLFDKKVNLILNPSASHFAFGKTLLREELVVSSSKNFNCAYVYANLLGNEAGRMIYDGEILIAQQGKLLARNEWLSYQQINLLSAYINTDDVQTTPPTYARDKNTEFVKAASLALFDYMRKSRSRGFVLSLSGGADSSTIAILVAEMVRRGVNELGLETFLNKIGYASLIKATSALSLAEQLKAIVRQILTCAYQGTSNSSYNTFKSAKALASEICATFYSWTIDEEVQSYTAKVENAIDRKLQWSSDDITLQNIQARARSPIIWMLANINNALLLTTSNRSEGDVGYATMDGDTSGSIAPIAAVDKYFIINWLKWAETTLGYKSLNNVNNLKPSAELRPLSQTQTDEADLMPYHVIVEIEKLAIQQRLSPVEVYKQLLSQELEPASLLKQHITKFFRLWCRNQWKRERIAPAFHLDDFNVDPRTWCRFPILSSGYETELKALENI